MNQYDKDREQLEYDLMQGVISNAEYTKQMREIYLDEMNNLAEEARQAYDDVINGHR